VSSAVSSGTLATKKPHRRGQRPAPRRQVSWKHRPKPVPQLASDPNCCTPLLYRRSHRSLEAGETAPPLHSPSPPRQAGSGKSSTATPHQTRREAKYLVFIAEIPGLGEDVGRSDRLSRPPHSRHRRMWQGRPESPATLLQLQTEDSLTTRTPAPCLSCSLAATPPRRASAWPGKAAETLRNCSGGREGGELS
jgi:hypothetical protein